MGSLLTPSTVKKLSSIPRRFFKFQALSHFNSSIFLGFSPFSTSSNNSHFPAADVEDSIYAILTIGRWESLNHMDYNLRSLRRVHGRLAIKFLDWIVKQPGLELEHITRTYCLTIHVLVKARMYNHARSLFYRLVGMSRDPSSLFGALMGTYRLCRSNPSVFDLLIRVYLKLGGVHSAVEVFRLMGSRGFNPSIYSCNVILSATLEHRLAWSFFKEMLARNICPDVSTFNALLNILCSEGKLKKAGYLLEKMEEAGCVPNAVTYNTILSCYSKKGRYKAACSIMDQMSCKGIKADVCTYNTLIDKLCRSEKSAKGYLVLKKMRNNKLVPNVVTYNTLINGFSKEGKFGVATKVFEEMVKHDLYPNHITYNTLLDGHCRQGNFEEAFSIMHKMEASGLSPNEVTYGTLLNGLCKHAKFELAQSVMESMRVKGIGGVGCIAYTTMMDGFCKNGMLKEAIELFIEMMKDRVYPDVITYSVLINGLCRAAKWVTAKELLCNMYRMGVLPNGVIHAGLIYNLCKQGRVTEALKQYAVMNFHGYKADTQTCNLLVGTLSSRRMFHKAEILMQHISRMATVPNSVTYDCMIDGYSNIGDVSKAFSFFDEMIRLGHYPSPFSYGSLLKGLCRSGNLWAAKRFLGLLEGVPGVTDVVAYNTLLGTMCKFGQLTEAVDLYPEMIQKNVLPDEHSYASLLSGLCKKGKLVIAILLSEDFMQKGILSSSLVVQTILVDALFKSGYPGVASYFYQDMVKGDLCLDVVAANTISDGYSRKGMMVKATEVFQFLNKNSAPDIVSYNILLHGYAKQGNLSKFFCLYNSLIRKGFLADNLTCYALILGLCEAQCIELAIKCLRSMILKGSTLDPMAFDLLIRKCSEHGYMVQVFDLLNVMMTLELQPARSIYDSIITGFIKLSAFEESRLVFHEMVKNSYVPSYRQCVTLMNGMLRTRDIAGAFRLKDEMVSLGVSSPDIADSALVRGLVNCGKINEAKIVFDFSLRKHQVPSVVTFTTMMHGFCKDDRVTEALSLRETMEKFKLKPDIIMYNVLISGLCAKGDVDVAFDLYNEMKQNGLWGNTTTFEALINGILDKDDLVNGEMILMDLQERGFISHVENSKEVKQLLLSALNKLNSLRQKKQREAHV